MATTIPAKGDRVSVSELSGYVLTQHRPYECRVACSCGECNGHSTAYPGVVREVIYWADNSIEATVDCDDGETRILRLSPPSEFPTPIAPSPTDEELDRAECEANEAAARDEADLSASFADRGLDASGRWA